MSTTKEEKRAAYRRLTQLCRDWLRVNKPEVLRQLRDISKISRVPKMDLYPRMDFLREYPNFMGHGVTDRRLRKIK